MIFMMIIVIMMMMMTLASQPLSESCCCCSVCLEEIACSAMAMMTMAIMMMMMMMTIMVIVNPYIDTYSIDLLLPVRKNIIHHLFDIFVKKKTSDKRFLRKDILLLQLETPVTSWAVKKQKCNLDECFVSFLLSKAGKYVHLLFILRHRWIIGG